MPISTCSSKRTFRTRLGAIGVVATAAFLTACGVQPAPRGELAQDQQTLASCDPTAPPAAMVAIDGTGSSTSDAILAERMTAIESIVRTTAICSGRLKVVVFASSSAATVTLFEGSLQLDGATDNARLKRVDRLVSDVMAKVRQVYQPAVTSLVQGGSDITSEYRLAEEWIKQVGTPFRLQLVMLTDGFQNVGVDLGARALSKQEAEALANQVAVPKLPGASVVVAGLGRVTGQPAPSNVVEGLVSYYDALCHHTEAAHCLSVTDYTTDGR